MSVMDFAALPPEINSGRMYAGSGSGPLIAAAAAWDGLAAELSSAATSYRTIVSELTDGVWRGPSATAMTTAVDPYVQWMGTTSAQAEQTASQARAAAAAYETAFSATVPPPVIAANRATLAALVATNILGQNTPAIAANEAQYAEMWAQDAGAMYGYAASSAAATTVTPFTAAPQDTNSAGPAAQSAAAAATGADSSASDLLQNLITLPIQFLSSPLMTQLNDLAGVTGLPLTLFTGPEFTAIGAEALVGPLMFAALSFPPFASTVSAYGMADGAAGMTLAGSESMLGAPAVARLAGAPMSAGLGRAAAVGGLSVPQSWATVAPEIRLAATALPVAGPTAVPQVGAAMPGGWFGGMPPVGSVVNAPRNGESGPRNIPRSKVMPGQSGGDGDAQSRWVQPELQTPGISRDIAGALSEREREEFERLREEVAEMATDCDAMTRLMAEALRP